MEGLLFFSPTIFFFNHTSTSSRPQYKRVEKYLSPKTIHIHACLFVWTGLYPTSLHTYTRMSIDRTQRTARRRKKWTFATTGSQPSAGEANILNQKRGSAAGIAGDPIDSDVLLSPAPSLHSFLRLDAAPVPQLNMYFFVLNRAKKKKKKTSCPVTPSNPSNQGPNRFAPHRFKSKRSSPRV